MMQQAGNWLCCHQGPRPMFVRYIYTVVFLLANILAWMERENPKMFFEWQRHSGCEGDRDCHAAEAVLIISLTCFLFFSVMFFSTVCTNKTQDKRNSWHCGWWPAKIALFVGSVVLSTLATSDLVQLYGKVTPFGAGVFLSIQLLSVIRYITRFNYGWCHVDIGKRYLLVVAISIIAHSFSLVGIILMSFSYNGCWLNIAFIGTTMLMVYLMPLISLKYEAKGFLAGPGLVGTYIVFLCFSAIRSEPETKCYKKEKAGAGANWETIFSFGFGLVSIAASVFSTGKDYKCIQLRCVVVSEDDVPYGYGFFHFVFAMGSMYFGMLFVGWDTHHTMEKWNMDVSWTSAWVHIVNEGLAVISFMAIVVARVYAIGWLRQLLARIFGIGDEPPHQPQQQQQQQFEMAILSGWSEDDDTEQEQEEQSATTAGFLSIPRPASPSSRRTGDGFSDVLSVSDDASYGGRSPSPASTDEIQEVTPPVDIAIAVAVLIDEEKRDRPASALRQRRRHTSHEGAGAGPSSSSSRPAILSDEEEV